MNNQNILIKIDSIDKEDLYLVEKDLCFEQKVSLAFLLFADNKANAAFILQKLLAMSRCPDESSDILLNYTTINEDWKPMLVEALATIEANKVLRKLGFDLRIIRTHFLPHIPEMSLYLNPILKALYSMCDRLTPNEAHDLVADIRITGEPSTNINFNDYNYLEVFLLDWITKEILDASGSETTNIALLIDYFKIMGMYNIKDTLEHSIRYVNLEAIEPAQKDVVQYETVVNQMTSLNVQQVKENLSKWYTVRKENAGIVLIINQRDFYECDNPALRRLLPSKKLERRTGTNIDAEALQKTFSSFGYTPIIVNNLDHIQMLTKIRHCANRSVSYDSFIVCVLSHGIEGSVFGCDSIPVKISIIKTLLTGETLVNKPRMLIIQACQGDTVQTQGETKQEGQLQHDGPGESRDYGDMVIAVSTVPGFVSLRHTKTGSWFIQTICEMINALGDTEDIMGILTEVNRAVDEKRGSCNERMTPIFSSTLRKRFRLPSRLE